MVFPNTIEKTTEVWSIVEKYVQIPLKHVLPLSSPMVLYGILKNHWEYHWRMIYCWKVCSDTIGITIETWFIIE